MSLLADQIAVVTGASSGIGQAIALGLAAQGATLCLVGRSSERLGAVADVARKTASRVFKYQADLALDRDIQDLATRIRGDLQSVDILIHSAGAYSQGELSAESVDNLDWQYRINVRAAYALTRALLPMLRLRRGQIVFVNSLAGLTARANVGQYAATKHALKAIADSLRDEVDAEGLRVLSVFLGKVATPMQAAIHKMEGKAYRPERLVQPEDVASVVINALSLPRTSQVTDVSIRPLTRPS